MRDVIDENAMINDIEKALCRIGLKVSVRYVEKLYVAEIRWVTMESLGRVDQIALGQAESFIGAIQKAIAAYHAQNEELACAI